MGRDSTDKSAGDCLITVLTAHPFLGAVAITNISPTPASRGSWGAGSGAVSGAIEFMTCSVQRAQMQSASHKRGRQVEHLHAGIPFVMRLDAHTPVQDTSHIHEHEHKEHVTCRAGFASTLLNCTGTSSS